MTFSATDRHNRAVRNLARAQLALLDDGKPVETITDFRNDGDRPLEIGILVDASESVERQFRAEKEVAVRAIERLLHAPLDRAFVLAFGSQVLLAQDITADMDRLTGAVRAIPPSPQTSLYDAVYVGSVHARGGVGPQVARRVLIVISDGEDNLSAHGLDEAITAAQRTDTRIYGLSFRKLQVEGERALRRMTDETGGQILNASGSEPLEKALARIAQDLEAQYSVAYRPVNLEHNGRFHRVQITVASGGTVRARKGYYAPIQ